GQTRRACGVVLTPATPSAAALVVHLPLSFTQTRAHTTALGYSEQARSLTTLLRQLQQEQPGTPVYYLAGVCPREDNRQAELALAATALGWPAGQFILVPAEGEDVV